MQPAHLLLPLTGSPICGAGDGTQGVDGSMNRNMSYMTGTSELGERKNKGTGGDRTTSAPFGAFCETSEPLGATAAPALALLLPVSGVDGGAGGGVPGRDFTAGNDALAPLRMIAGLEGELDRMVTGGDRSWDARGLRSSSGWPRREFTIITCRPRLRSVCRAAEPGPARLGELALAERVVVAEPGDCARVEGGHEPLSNIQLIEREKRSFAASAAEVGTRSAILREGVVVRERDGILVSSATWSPVNDLGNEREGAGSWGENCTFGSLATELLELLRPMGVPRLEGAAPGAVAANDRAWSGPFDVVAGRNPATEREHVICNRSHVRRTEVTERSNMIARSRIICCKDVEMKMSICKNLCCNNVYETSKFCHDMKHHTSIHRPFSKLCLSSQRTIHLLTTTRINRSPISPTTALSPHRDNVAPSSDNDSSPLFAPLPAALPPPSTGPPRLLLSREHQEPRSPGRCSTFPPLPR